MGRPTKLNEETQTRFITGLKLGLTYDLAASYAGVDVRTVYGWFQRGRDEDDGIYCQFLQAVKAAEGACAAVCMGRIQKAAEAGQWQAAGWIMERRYGYSQRQDVKIEAAPADAALEGAEDIIAKVAEVAAALKGAPVDENDD